MATATGKDLTVSEIPMLDKQIEILMECKPLPENEVKALCERVSRPSIPQTQFLIYTIS